MSQWTVVVLAHWSFGMAVDMFHVMTAPAAVTAAAIDAAAVVAAQLHWRSSESWHHTAAERYRASAVN